MAVASHEPRSVCIFHILQRISKTQMAKNKYAYSSTFFYWILLSSGMWCHKVFHKLTHILEHPEDIRSWILQDVSKYLSDYTKDSIFSHV